MPIIYVKSLKPDLENKKKPLSSPGSVVALVTVGRPLGAVSIEIILRLGEAIENFNPGTIFNQETIWGAERQKPSTTV